MKTAADVMNRTFFHVSPSDSIGGLLHQMAERGLGRVPVLDSTGRPIGVATTGEIESCYDVDELMDRLARPAACVEQNTPIEVAARALAQHPSCSLILVDGRGVAVGELSPVELLRAVLGVEEGVASIPERDAAWEQADMLELGAAHRAPEVAGIILLSPGVDASKRRQIWAEPAGNMRERLDQMLREPQLDEELESILEAYPRTVRFRCLTIQDEAQREQLADALGTIERKSSRRPLACIEPESLPATAARTASVTRSVRVDSRASPADQEKSDQCA